MTALLRKEWTELLRSYRALYVPLVFLLFTLMNIVLMKMMPDMLRSGAGNLPKGTIIEIPPPTALEAMQKMLGVIDQFGALVLILAFMGTIAGERASGVMTTILIKPVSRLSYAGSKLIAALLLTIASYAVAAGAGYLYADLLFDDKLNLSGYLTGIAIYLPKLLFIAVMVLFFSAVFRSAVAAGGVSLAVYMVLSFTSGIGPLQDRLPTSLSGMASMAFSGEQVQASEAMSVTFLLMLVLFAGTCWVIMRRAK